MVIMYRGGETGKHAGPLLFFIRLFYDLFRRVVWMDFSPQSAKLLNASSSLVTASIFKYILYKKSEV